NTLALHDALPIYIKEFAPHVRPAGGLDNPIADEQLIEPSVAIGVNDAAEVLKMRLRMLAFAVRRVEKQRGRRPRPGKRPLVANIGPQPAGLGLAGAGREDRHWGIIDMKRLARQDVG